MKVTAMTNPPSNANGQHANYRHNAQQVWQDRCRVCKINDTLVALPYSDAAQYADYELGATIAAIAANRLLRRLVSQK